MVCADSPMGQCPRSDKPLCNPEPIHIRTEAEFNERQKRRTALRITAGEEFYNWRGKRGSGFGALTTLKESPED